MTPIDSNRLRNLSLLRQEPRAGESNWRLIRIKGEAFRSKKDLLRNASKCYDLLWSHLCTLWCGKREPADDEPCRPRQHRPCGVDKPPLVQLVPEGVPTALCDESGPLVRSQALHPERVVPRGKERTLVATAEDRVPATTSHRSLQKGATEPEGRTAHRRPAWRPRPLPAALGVAHVAVELVEVVGQSPWPRKMRANTAASPTEAWS